MGSWIDLPQRPHVGVYTQESTPSMQNILWEKTPHQNGILLLLWLRPAPPTAWWGLKPSRNLPHLITTPLATSWDPSSGA